MPPPVSYFQTILPVSRLQRDHGAVEQRGEHEIVHDGRAAERIAGHLRVPDDLAVRGVQRHDLAVVGSHLAAEVRRLVGWELRRRVDRRDVDRAVGRRRWCEHAAVGSRVHLGGAGKCFEVVVLGVCRPGVATTPCRDRGRARRLRPTSRCSRRPRARREAARASRAPDRGRTSRVRSLGGTSGACRS